MATENWLKMKAYGKRYGYRYKKLLEKINESLSEKFIDIITAENFIAINVEELKY